MGNGQSAAVERSQALILDVRTDSEYCTGHICGAILVPTPVPPLSDAQVEQLHARLDHLLRGRPRSDLIVVYCRKGVRAALAARYLEKRGFLRVQSLGGVETEPLRAYVAKGRPNAWWWAP